MTTGGSTGVKAVSMTRREKSGSMALPRLPTPGRTAATRTCSRRRRAARGHGHVEHLDRRPRADGRRAGEQAGGLSTPSRVTTIVSTGASGGESMSISPA
jgi:hypothetical protein